MSMPIPPFLMVITKVDEETKTVTLTSVFDWDVPCVMYWYYGYDGNPIGITDKVGQTFEVKLRQLSE